MATYTKDHLEVPDPTPVEMPVGYEIPESLESMIARMIKSASVRAAQSGKYETLEESDDFGEDDSDELVSPYQMSTMQEEQPSYATVKQQRERDARRKPAAGPEGDEKATPAKAEVRPMQPVENTQENGKSGEKPLNKQ